MKNLLHKLINAGLDANTSPENKDVIKTLNFLSVSLFGLISFIEVFAILFLEEHRFFTTLVCFIQLLFFIIIIALNYVDKHSIAKLVFSFDISLISILLVAYYGIPSNFHYLVPISFLSLIFIYRNGSRGDFINVLVFQLLTIGSFLIILLTDFSIVKLEGQELFIIRFFAFTSICLTTLVIGSYLFITSTQRHRETQQSIERLSKDARILSTISANVDQAFFKSDPENGFEFLNHSFARLFGYNNVKEIQATNAYEIYYNVEDREHLIQKLRKERSVNNTLMRYKRKDGSMFYGRLSCNMISEKGSERIVGVIADVTQQHEQEEKLRLNELRLKEAQRIAKMGHWQLNQGDLSMIWSDEAYRLHGFSKDTPPPAIEDLVKRFEGFDIKFFQRVFEDVRKQNEPIEFGGWYTDPLGIKKYLEFRVRFVNEPLNGNYWVGTIQDITELKQMEQDMVGNTNFFETILNNAPIEITILNEALKYVFVSDQAIPNKDLRKWIIGKTDKEFCKYLNQPSSLHLTRENYYNKALETNEVVRWEEEITDEYGRRNFLFRNAVVVNDPVNKEKHLVGFAFNVTRLRESQISLEDKNEELQKLNQELDRFVYSISHDLRAPIASVIGLISLAEESDSLEEAKNILAMQREALDRLDVYIRDVIDYSRNKRIDARIENLELDEIIARSLQNQANIPSYHRIEFFFEYDAGKHVWSDRMRVQIIVNNLLSNAIKYYDSSKEHPFIKVGTKRLKNGLELVVQDNGIGIKSLYKNRIWEMFYRGTSESSGSGLGLYILKESLKQLNGTVSLETEEGKGTTFTVFIPDLNA